MRGTVRPPTDTRKGAGHAADTHLIAVLTLDELKRMAPSLGERVLQRGYQGTWDAIQSRGAQYELVVDRGEAYTHAAGWELLIPVLSNDVSAQKALTQQHLSFPRTLRTFDIFALAVHAGDMKQSEMGSIRGTLTGMGERVPYAFRHKSYEDGLAEFDVRVVDASRDRPPGCTNPLPLHPVATPSAATPQLPPAAAAPKPSTD